MFCKPDFARLRDAKYHRLAVLVFLYLGHGIYSLGVLIDKSMILNAFIVKQGGIIGFGDVFFNVTYQFPVMEIGKLDGDATRHVHVACLNDHAKTPLCFASLILHACGMQNTTAWRCWFFCILAMGFIP